MAVSLLVADDDLLHNLVKDVLEEGFLVYQAADGEAALDIFWEYSELSLEILDIMMPKIDGIELVCSIQYSK